ncbi:presenilin family intramembrane aspartyl protease PSH [Archaeoglobus veneficus]|uniref:Signal-peptide peptidase, presenilin aspartyl protease n=1 Tax=Archaeoglobus veneficus (strain DSM 11195 / SNP6) TaxID=693661 RepID=F2KS50_ARCVS|nr:presenilin family intramembrane aspartyl protease PSH [Archaeoglobus veneficus]AEA47989.1 protein of unknown function DUF1119 [Archaeoglobus veneficus SNP6]
MKARYAILAIYFFAALVAIAVTPEYEAAGVQAFENPGDISNSILYFVAILAFTAFILVVSRYKAVLQLVMYGLILISVYYVIYPFAGLLSAIPAVIIVLFLVKKPNWIVIDVSAFLLSVGIISIFGISLEPLPAIVLLLILAIYDAISVYRTKHMISLAESVTRLRLPLLFVIPLTRDFSFEAIGSKEGEEKKAIYIGVGDIVVPNILVVSAQHFTSSPAIGFIKLSALMSLSGGLIGLAILLRMVGKPQAGLPFLNIPTIAGYLLSQLL